MKTPKEMLEDCSGLTAWEMDFLESIEKQIEYLSPRQEDVLIRIWEEKA